jgi:hypothetical protein
MENDAAAHTVKISSQLKSKAAVLEPMHNGFCVTNKIN